MKDADGALRGNDKKVNIMRIGTSLTLIAIGAILAFAVHVHLDVISFFAVGVILMLVGAIGPLLTGSAVGGRGIVVSRPSFGQPRDESDLEQSVAIELGTDETDDSDVAQPLPQARATDSPWSSPRSGLRAI